MVWNLLTTFTFFLFLAYIRTEIITVTIIINIMYYIDIEFPLLFLGGGQYWSLNPGSYSW
jgi:hypothetical protein